jgi:hypothetical protein
VQCWSAGQQGTPTTTTRAQAIISFRGDGTLRPSIEAALMSSFYEEIAAHNKGAWVIHHSQKTATTVNGAAEFPAMDAAGKSAALLSQMAATSQSTLDGARVNALAKAAGLSRIELPELLRVLARQRLIEISANGDVEVLGLTSRATVQHAAEIFDEQGPTPEERASIVIAEVTSDAPVPQAQLVEFVGDEFKLAAPQCHELLVRSETVGFVDAEGENAEKLYFNGNLFRRDNLVKAKRVLESLSQAEQAKVTSIDGELARRGCIDLGTVEAALGKPLFEKLRAAGMYDVNHVANPSGEYGFVTRPAAFHKFNDPLVDDAFDLAKALVAALSYGVTQSHASRGRIEMIGALLRKLINGYSVGPATAIGEDYRVLETKGVIQVTPARSYGYTMRLLKQDIGEMALNVLITGEAASTNVIDRPLPGTMTGYVGPERTRSDFRRKQKHVPVSRRGTEDVLQALRTRGKF